MLIREIKNIKKRKKLGKMLFQKGVKKIRSYLKLIKNSLDSYPEWDK